MEEPRKGERAEVWNEAKSAVLHVYCPKLNPHSFGLVEEHQRCVHQESFCNTSQSTQREREHRDWLLAWERFRFVALRCSACYAYYNTVTVN